MTIHRRFHPSVRPCDLACQPSRTSQEILNGGFRIAQPGAVDIGDAVAVGIGEADPRREGEIGAEAVGRGQAGPFADQHHQHAGADDGTDLVTQRDACARRRG